MNKIKGLKVFKTKHFYDKRGYFVEIFKKKFLKKNFIFSCISHSKKNVLRGLHLQLKNPQGKFLTVIEGKIFDVVVDLRRNSKTFGRYFSIILESKDKKSLYIPEGFAHGFLCLKKSIVCYFCTKYRDKKSEIGIIWNDKNLNINWPVKKPILSKKDEKNLTLEEYLELVKLK